MVEVSLDPEVKSSLTKDKEEQLWRYDSATKKLTNKKNIWTSASDWILPEPGTSGPIENTAEAKVLEVNPVETEKDVTLKVEITDQDIDRQKWFRREDFDNGCFVLSNKLRYLTAKEEPDKDEVTLKVDKPLEKCKCLFWRRSYYV